MRGRLQSSEVVRARPSPGGSPTRDRSDEHVTLVQGAYQLDEERVPGRAVLDEGDELQRSRPTKDSGRQCPDRFAFEWPERD